MTQELFRRCENLGIAHRLNDSELADMLSMLVEQGDWPSDFEIYAAALAAKELADFRRAA